METVNVAVATCVYDRLVGLVVKASASRAEGPGFESCLRRDFSGVIIFRKLLFCRGRVFVCS